MSCPDLDLYIKYFQQIDQTVEIDKQKDKPLRYNVWDTTAEEVANLINNQDVSSLTNPNQSPHIKQKLENAMKRLKRADHQAKGFIKDIITAKEGSVEMSIALHEIMESVKGEADKARNLGIGISEITNDKVLPVLPLPRIAATIGRKIAFKHGHRFSAQNVDGTTSAEIELMYHELGMVAIEQLVDKGYLNLHDNVSTIKDYITAQDLKKDVLDTNKVVKDVRSVSLNSDKLGIKYPEDHNAETDPLPANVAYFLDRTDSDISDTELGTVTEILRAVRHITQPSTIVLPDTTPLSGKKLDEALRQWDDPRLRVDNETHKIRKKMYEKPVYVHESVHSLMTLLNAEAMAEGESASKMIRRKFKAHPTLINSLFGLKRSDDFSIDKKESVAGQNLSKTTPLDDLVEHYHILQGDNTDPVPLHMMMKIGRNMRLYYNNSVLNAHASKQSRYMLTAGPYTVDSNSADFQYLAYNIGQTLDKELTFDQLVGNADSKLDKALEIFDRYESATKLQGKLAALSSLAHQFPGVDYASLLTGLKGVKDMRNPVDGVVTTQFQVSADATASGGTLTFMQALGSNPDVESFLEDIGFLKKEDGSVKVKLKDLYQIMSNTIEDFINGKPIENLIGQDLAIEKTGNRQLLDVTLNLLFSINKPHDQIRELSKDPTMTFVYGQGRKGAVDTMARSLADRIIDNLDDENTRQFLSQIFNNASYNDMNSDELKNVRGLYNKIIETLKKNGLPEQLYDLIDASVNQAYLSNFKSRSKRLFKLVEKLPKNVDFKILPAAFVVNQKGPTTLKDIKTFGMPISKIFEVSSDVNGTTVLTRKQKTQQTVQDVSTVHSIDSAGLYQSIGAVDPETGVVVVHDDVRGTVQTVRQMEETYKEKMVEITEKYDIHQQILESLALYSPQLKNDPDFQALQKEIDAAVAQKKRVLADRFNNETNALIGDGDAFRTLAEKSKGPTRTAPEPKAKVEEEAESEIRDQKASEILHQLAPDSEIISRFLADDGKGINSKILGGDINQFDSVNDTITISEIDNRLTNKVTHNINTTHGRKAIIEMVEHEIVHSYTVGTIVDQVKNKEISNELRYVAKTIEQLQRRLDPDRKDNQRDKLSEPVLARLDYAMRSGQSVQSAAEFIAIMQTEPAVAEEVVRFFGESRGSRLRAALKKIGQFFREQLRAVSDSDLAGAIDPDLLMDSITHVVHTGRTMRQDRAEAVREAQKGFDTILGVAPNLDLHQNEPDVPKMSIRYANFAVANMLNSRLERGGKKVVGKVHDFAQVKFPLYFDVVQKLQGIYDSSDALQQLVHTITGNNIDKLKKADILALMAKISNQRNDLINDQVGKLNKLLKPLSEQERADLGRYVMEMPLHDYFNLASDLRTEEQIQEEITALEKELRKTQPAAIRDVDEIVQRNIRNKDTDTPAGRIYNLDAAYPMDSEFGIEVRKLLALKSIDALGTKKFLGFLEHVDLMDLVKDQVVANRLSILKNQGESQVNDSMVPEYAKEKFQLKVLEEGEIAAYENGENTGWEILQTPTKTRPGIVFRKTIDSSDIAGAFTDIKLSSGDIKVPDKFRNYDGVMKTRDGLKLVLNKDQKKRLGMVEDWTQSLVRSTAHNMAIQDSQIIRDELIKKETRFELNAKNEQNLLDRIAADNIDSPWFIKMEPGMEYEKLPKEVRAKYQKVKRVSDVRGFNEEVDLVRKDISHWLMGGSSRSLFDNPKMKWAMRITKNLVAGAKIGMVVLNPLKIARDNVSNISYLGVMGVPPQFVAKNYRDITQQFNEYQQLQGQIVALKVQITARPDSTKLKQRLKSLQDQVKRNPVGDLAEKGFINSLGSDLVSRNADTLSGLQADVHTAVEYLLSHKNGGRNHLGEFIHRVHKLGFNGEDFLNYLGGIVGRFESGKGAQRELDMIAERLRDIRNDDDVVAYASQYLNSPGSEAVRLGSAMTDLTDVLAKETLYRHLIENENMSPENARLKVLDSFPDYKENMPLAVKQLSDVGILMFPSFWLRIQKSIYRLGRDRPINLATELMIEEALGSNIDTIVDSNIFNKANTFGGLLHSPHEPIGVGSFVPTNLF